MSQSLVCKYECLLCVSTVLGLRMEQGTDTHKSLPLGSICLVGQREKKQGKHVLFYVVIGARARKEVGEGIGRVGGVPFREWLEFYIGWSGKALQGKVASPLKR